MRARNKEASKKEEKKLGKRGAQRKKRKTVSTHPKLFCPSIVATNQGFAHPWMPASTRAPRVAQEALGPKRGIGCVSFCASRGYKVYARESWETEQQSKVREGTQEDDESQGRLSTPAAVEGRSRDALLGPLGGRARRRQAMKAVNGGLAG